MKILRACLSKCKTISETSMAAFSSSSIVGYRSHLLLKNVSLPLKYLREKERTDSVDEFRSRVFGFGGFIDLKGQKGLFFSSLQYGVDNDMKTIYLTPILTDEVTSIDVQFQSIEIHLPHPVIGKGMMEFHFTPLSTDMDPYIVIDLMDESYLLITLKIELSDFLVNDLTNRLVLDSFNEWVNISVPYSFELRSPPFFMKALDEKNLIISMKDGGLLHFARHSALSAVDIFNFTETSVFLSLGFGGIFGSNTGDNTVDGISSNATVDIARIDDDTFVTLTVSKVLKFWTMVSHKQIHSTIELEKSQESSTWLTSIPSKYLQVHGAGSVRYLSVAYTVEGEIETTSGYVIKSFEIQNGCILVAGALSWSPDQPASSSEGEVNAFKIQDFHIQDFQEPSNMKYFVLWKSNTYSILMCYDIESKASVVGQVCTSISPSRSHSEELFMRHEDCFYENAIFNSGSYSENIVATALNIFKSKSGHTSSGLVGFSLRQEVHQTILRTSKAIGVSSTSLWYKLFLICEEFRKISKESFSLQVTPTFVLTCEVDGVGVFRKAHRYEEFEKAKLADTFAVFLNALSSKLSWNTKSKLIEEMKDLVALSASDATRLASSYLGSKISDNEVARIMDEMRKIPDVVDTINNLIGKDFDHEVIFDELPGVRPGEGFGLFSLLLTARTFKNIRTSHETTLINLFILFLLCEPSDSILGFLNAIVQRFSRYSLFDKIFDICFEDCSPKCGLERNNVNSLENSIFWTAIVNRFPELLRLIKDSDYNAAFDYYSENVLADHSEIVVLNVVLDLLNRNEALVITEKFSQTLQSNKPLIRFLSGLVYLCDNKPSQFFSVMSNYETFEAISNKKMKQLLLEGLSSHPQLNPFLSSIFSRPLNDILARANYFHELAHLSKSYFKSSSPFASRTGSDLQLDFIKESFEFGQKAVQILDGAYEQDTEIRALKCVFLRDLFEEALEISDLNEAISSLEKMTHLISKAELKLLFTRLMKILISRREISRAFRAGENKLFVDNYLLVDRILLDIANNDLILSNALKCYEFLYSWRLLGPSIDGSYGSGDMRGAVESLYIFITRFRLEQENLGQASEESENFKQFKLKILELYMIIINCLKAFQDKDDMWFIKRDSSEKLGVIKISELTIEYYMWLKELESDLAEGIA